MIIIPHLITKDDSVSWTNKKATSCINHFLFNLHDSLGNSNSIYFVSDNQKLVKNFQGHLVKKHFPTSHDHNIIALGSLKKNITLTDSTPVVVVNTHKPLQSISTLKKAIDMYMADKTTVLPVRKLDFPLCQADRHLKLINFDIFHFLEPGSLSASTYTRRTTKPFYFPWSMYCSHASPGVYKRISNRNGLLFKQAKKEDDDTLFIFERKNIARLLIPHHHSSHDIYLEGLTKFTQHQSSTEWHFNFTWTKNTIIEVIGFNQSGPIHSLTEKNFLKDGTLSLPNTFVKDISGFFLISAQNIEESSEPDMSFPFTPSGELWTTDSKGLHVNRMTKELITGRQQSPEIYELTEEFIVGSYKDIISIDTLIHKEQFNHILSTAEDLYITSEFDLLNYNILQLDRNLTASF